MQKSDYRNMWVYIEHDGVTAAPVGLELCCELRKLCDTRLQEHVGIYRA